MTTEDGQQDPSSDIPGEIPDEEAEQRTFVAMEKVLSTLESWDENGVPVLLLCGVEDEDGEGNELSVFTELRGLHLATKQQNAVLAKIAAQLARIADAADTKKKSS